MNFQKGIVYATLATLFISCVTPHYVQASTSEYIDEAAVHMSATAQLYAQEIVNMPQQEATQSIEEEMAEEVIYDVPTVVTQSLPLMMIEETAYTNMQQSPTHEAENPTANVQYITTNATYMDALTAQQAVHTYAFHVTGKTKVTWQYKHVDKAQWHHTLYDASQQVIGTKMINSSSYGLFTTYDKILEPGTYYMTITGNDVALDEHYTFTLTEVLPKMFDDVGNDHPYRDEIGAIQQMGIVTGFENNMFEPDTFIQRKHIAAMIMRAEANVRLLNAPENFVDVPYGHPYYQDIMGLYRSYIIDGKVLEDGVYFEPDAQITRAQLAKILVNAFTIQPADGTSYYVDVTEDKWFYEAANTLASHGIFFDNTLTFNGDTLVTRAEFAHLLYRAMHVTH